MSKKVFSFVYPRPLLVFICSCSIFKILYRKEILIDRGRRVHKVGKH